MTTGVLAKLVAYVMAHSVPESSVPVPVAMVTWPAVSSPLIVQVAPVPASVVFTVAVGVEPPVIMWPPRSMENSLTPLFSTARRRSPDVA